MKRTFFTIVMIMVFTLLCGCEGVKDTNSTSEEVTTTAVKMEVYEDVIPRTTDETTADVVTETTSETSTTELSSETTNETQTSTTVVTSELIATTTIMVESTDPIEATLEAPPMPTETETLSYSIYYVQSGDWFSHIANIYGIDMYTLAQFNDMSVDDIIHPGDEIKIPVGYVMNDSSYEPVYNEPDYSYGNQSTYSDGLVHYGCDTKYSWTAGWASFYNMSVASDVLTNQVAYIPPGGSFSWLTDVGPCTSSPYVESSGYSGGQVVQVYGGGICMTASALKVAAINAGCIITETHPHSMPVTYNDRSKENWELYESAIDASGCDLRFYNPSATTGLTIRAYTDMDNGTCTVELIPD